MPTPSSPSSPNAQPESVSGVMAMTGRYANKSKSFWAEAWDYVRGQRGAKLGLLWVALLIAFAAFAPLIANGHPYILRELDTQNAQQVADAFFAEAELAVTTSQGKQYTTEELLIPAIEKKLQLQVGASTPAEYFAAAEGVTEIDAAINAIAEALSSDTALNETGKVAHTSSPLWEQLTPGDLFFIAFTPLAALFMLPSGKFLGLTRGSRLGIIFTLGTQGAIVALGAGIIAVFGVERDAAQWLRTLTESANIASLTLVIPSAAIVLLLPNIKSFTLRAGSIAVTAVALFGCMQIGFNNTPLSYDYFERVNNGEAEATFAPVPFSPFQRFGDRDTANASPMTRMDEVLSKIVVNSLVEWNAPVIDEDNPFTPDRAEEFIDRGQSIGKPFSGWVLDTVPDRIDELPISDELKDTIKTDFSSARENGVELNRIAVDKLLKESLASAGSPAFIMGTDAEGKDVFSQMVHGCRLAISIGLISTAMTVIIGIIVGAVMGYFSGLADMLLYRLVEIVQGVPVLFLLIIIASVLPRNIFVMMFIIGCFGWTGNARFIRAEFLKLRKMDFVQSAKAAGLPLHSILFKHMLPNGVTPVLVNASFGIAAAILFESSLSFLGLGPTEQASWGRILKDANSEGGIFYWWLAVIPTAGIFFSVLSFVMIGESFRDAIDPKRKKARA